MRRDEKEAALVTLQRELELRKSLIPSRRARRIESGFFGLGLAAALAGLAWSRIADYFALGLALVGVARLWYGAIKYADTDIRLDREVRRIREILAEIERVSNTPESPDDEASPRERE